MSIKAEAKKDRLISDFIQVRHSILEAASSLSPAQQDQVFLGIWSVKDLLAHLVGWDLANIEAIQAILAGKLPAFYAHHDRGWKTFNDRLVAQHKRDNFEDLLSSVEDSHQQLIDVVKTIPAEEFDKDRDVRFKRYKVTIARTLQAEIDDEKTHHRQVKEFGDTDNP